MKQSKAICLAIGSFLGIWGFSHWLYLQLCPGIPDAGLVPLGVRPWLFAVYEGWSHFLSLYAWQHLNVVWLVSCAAFFVPIFFAAQIEVERSRRIVLAALIALLLCMATWHIWSAREIYFMESVPTSRKLVALIAWHLLPIAVIQTLAVVIGRAVSRFIGSGRVAA